MSALCPACNRPIAAWHIIRRHEEAGVVVEEHLCFDCGYKEGPRPPAVLLPPPTYRFDSSYLVARGRGVRR